MEVPVYSGILVFITVFINVEAAKKFIAPFNTTYYDPKKCGIPLNFPRSKRYVRKSHSQLKIMGGSDVSFGEHPWAVEIIIDGHVMACTGTLISKKHVITAAHCLMKPESDLVISRCSVNDAFTEKDALKRVTVYYGSNCLSRIDECTLSPSGKFSKIVRAQYGRYFRNNCRDSDFALLELEDEIDERVANYICLGNRIVAPKTIRRAVAIGWGFNPLVNRNKGYFNHLQKIEFAEVLDYELCKHLTGLLNDIICTAETTYENLCMGDSGGGIMTQLDDGRWVLLGITSSGTSCNNLLSGGKRPGYQSYTNVRMFTADIDKFTGFLAPWEI